MARKQNTVYLGRDNPVVINFTFVDELEADGLTAFTDVQVSIGGESYTLLLDPASVVVQSSTQLRILIGAVTSLEAGDYKVGIVGVGASHPNGYVLNDACASDLPYIAVRECP